MKDTFWNILTFTDDASDAYIDKVLENLRQAIADNGLDPADLPNGEVGFSETILGITFHGKAEVHDGFFQGTYRLIIFRKTLLFTILSKNLNKNSTCNTTAM